MFTGRPQESMLAKLVTFSNEILRCAQNDMRVKREEGSALIPALSQDGRRGGRGPVQDRPPP